MAGYRSFALILICVVTLSPAFGVESSKLQSFAKNFQCSNPNLQWQFDNLISLYDQNAAAGVNDPVTYAKHVGGDGEWMYRGVTNRQFNESQILALIFNDTTTVSESRWFSGEMFKNANIASTTDFVTQRANYQNLPFKRRWSAFKTAFTKVKSDIESLVNDKSGYGISGFDEHVRVGSSYNATPQAIQFLTPHKSYAEGYGEFVLHIKEVVQRGIDVERYNFNHPRWSYRIGSIYYMDRDEYMVPTHIPQWDVQIVKVRNGTGWHRGNYGPPIYYYTKVYEPNNPCNVLGIRIDKPGSRGDDNRRSPVGMILKCKKGQNCSSVWDGALPATDEARLRAVVESSKVDDQSLYYIPYAAYMSGDPAFLKTMTLSSIVGLYSHLKKSIKSDVKLWKELVLDGYKKDPAAALKILELNPVVKNIKAEWKQDAQKYFASKDFKLSKDNVEEVLELALELSVLPSQDIEKEILKLLKNPGDRLEAFSIVDSMKSKHSSLRQLTRKMREKLGQMADLAPSMEVALLQSDEGAMRASLVQAVAKGLSKEVGFASSYWNIVQGDDTFKIQLLEDGFDYINNNPSFAINDSFALFNEFDAFINNVSGRENILGACIDYAIANYSMPAFELAEKVGAIGLPKDREVDTIRSLWGYAKNEATLLGDTPTNKYRFVATSLRYSIYNQINYRSDLDQQVKDDHKRAFNQFYWEFVSPPAPILSFAALNSFRKIVGEDDLILIWPTEDTIKVSLSQDEEYEVDKTHLEAILGQSLSVYYFWQLKEAYDYESDSTRKAAIKNTIKTVVEKSREYILNGLDQDLSDPSIVELIKDQFEMSEFADTAGFLTFIATVTKNRSEKRSIEQLAKKIETLVPGTKAILPDLFGNGGSSISSNWEEVLK